ncbi:fatty acyl-AMP ligase [Mycobacteroides immunogenum]|uniref:Fatty-acid--CoA ligase n=1 Tax=Mycobacteroides immunogenum TaxID=83262 RepID=A0A7V8RVI6_9MYCO|nr:fatty acyl-AMP ligase [Mycobacteroides immunogenum]AMT69987.1 fatty-acid--CoA ligase [Mycobacteroides immunogenum]ANO06764.1 fatty-acid--CoA ligase [Mycobacteroides immunogenum]KIU38419.1 fatty-acid--CoA ligase [Mycobacteroides immunogenum]KPG05514.1 fatty-acid--CoA ligase [Mycobacteroides immunogenum]KPG06385.1 fatty-acid--CoA ligase [Mycobacteroides immunogenum]
MSDGVAVRQSGIENYLDAAGSIDLPPGTTLLSNFERNIAEFATTAAYRYLDFTRDDDGVAIELSWDALNTRMRAIGARLQQVTARGDRVAILAPQGLDYVIGFFAAIQAGNIAVPLFAPELPGHTERLDAVLADATPSVILTTDAAAESVNAFLRKLPRQRRPRVIAIDAVPDSVGATFTPAELDTDDLAYLQYTSGSTRTPAGVEITHRAACTNVLQMILAGGLDMDIRSVSWLPLYHDMGLIMILFPPLCGGHITLMSPLAFVRRPRRWVKQLAAESAYGRVFAAAPNFAFELAAQRGLPPAGETWDLSNVAGLLNGSEPVTISAIEKFTEAFAPYGFPASAIKPSYGMAEATLSVATIGIHDRPSVIHLDREQLADDRAVPVSADAPTAVPHVSCGQVISSQWLVIVDPQTGTELPEGEIGEIWLHGDNVGRGYWGRGRETEATFHNRLHARLTQASHAIGTAENSQWLRTGDLGVYLNDNLYVTGRIKDLVIIDGRNHYPQDIEATASASSPAVRSGYVAAFSVAANQLAEAAIADISERLVIVAERAPGSGRAEQAPVIEAIRAAISRTHALPVADVRLVAAGAIPRTTSGKLARRACQAEYLAGVYS